MDNPSSGTDRIVIERRTGYLWVTLPENIVVQDYSHIEDEILKQVKTSDGQIVFDFVNVRAIYSTGISILLRIHKRVSEKGGMICLVNVCHTIIDLFASLNLDKVFPLYPTDVEFEISKDEVWSQRLSERKIDFLFIAQVENGIYRITISGEMASGHDLTACRQFAPDPHVSVFVLDLSSLSAMDSSGAGVFMSMLDRIAKRGGTCRAFGAVRPVQQVLQFLAAEQYMSFCKTETDALRDITA